MRNSVGIIADSSVDSPVHRQWRFLFSGNELADCEINS